MRGGYLGNQELQKLAERADSPCRVITEAVVTESEDLIDTPTEWLGKDVGGGGFATLPDGGIRLVGSSTPFAELLTDTSPNAADMDIGRPPSAASVFVATVEWDGVAAEDQQLHTLTARLHPDYDGGGSDVAWWICQVFRVAAISENPSDGESVWELLRITDTIQVAAGPVVADVQFILSSPSWIPTVGPAPRITGGGEEISAPTTVILIWGVDGAGSPASNVRWLTDDTSPQVSSNGHELKAFKLAAYANNSLTSRDSLWSGIVQQGGVPRMSLGGQVYTESVITFSTNPIDLGSVPTGEVELVAEGHQPNGASLTFEVWDGAAWQEYADGDVVGADNTAVGGFDLTGVAVSQTYDMRLTLTPNTSGRVTPYAKRMGARSVTKRALYENALPGSVEYAVDPKTMGAAVPEIEITFVQDGIRDYRSEVTELFSDNYLGDLSFRMFYGAPTPILPRRYWLHLDDFVPEDWDSAGAGIRVRCLSPLSKLLRKIPLLDTINQKRQAAVYEGVTIAAAFDDIVRGQAGLPGRYIGPGPTDTQTVTKTIADAVDGRAEAERLAFLAGGAYLPSQGRLKFVDFETKSPPVDAFRRDEVTVVRATPGYEHRITDFAVPFGWNPARNDGQGGFRSVAYATADRAIETLDRALIETELELDHDTARWVEQDLGSEPNPTSVLGDRVGTRQVQYFGFGMILLEVTCSEYPRPWLEAGDPVVVPTDELVFKDPLTGNAIRGPINALGRVIKQVGFDGRRFLVWVKSAADIFPDATSLLFVGYANPVVLDVAIEWQAGGDARVQVTGNADSGSFRVAAEADGPFPSPTVVDAEAAFASDTDHQGEATLSLGAAPDEEHWFSVRAYENADGSGAKSLDLFKIKSRNINPQSLQIAETRLHFEPITYGAAPQPDNGSDEVWLTVVPLTTVGQSMRVIYNDDRKLGADVTTVTDTDTLGEPINIGSVGAGNQTATYSVQLFSGPNQTGVAGPIISRRFWSPRTSAEGLIRGTGGDGSKVSRPSIGVPDKGFALQTTADEIGYTVAPSQALPGSSGTVNVDRALGSMFYVSATGDLTLNPTNFGDSQTGIVFCTMGAHDLTIAGATVSTGEPWMGDCVVSFARVNGKTWATVSSQMVAS